MAAAGGEENLVKFYFYSGSTISSARKKELINLAYSTARDATQAPKEILVRLVYLNHGFIAKIVP